MTGNTEYYDQKLAAEKLKRVYEIAPPRIARYLTSEIDHVRSKISPGDSVLELGCGYGRILTEMANESSLIVGIDKSRASLKMASDYLKAYPEIKLAGMKAEMLGFKDNSFDMVICLQNGISAFKVDNLKLLSEAYRIAKRGGLVMFSSYARDFWIYRLQWFEAQANEGLLGEIDYDKTGDGEITCKDGFKASTYSPTKLTEIASQLGLNSITYTIDDSSVFLEIRKP